MTSGEAHDEEAQLYRDIDEMIGEEKDTIPLMIDSKQPDVGGQAVHAKKKISPWIMIPTWLCLSGGVILCNKYIFTQLNFPFPVFLTAYHMLIATIGTQILRYTTSMLSQVDSMPMTRPVWIQAILPLGILFSLSLVLSNVAYVLLSVSFVQMLKAFIPVLVHLISTVIGIATLDLRMALILGMISIGCVVATLGELRYSFIGFLCQAAAVIVESARLVLIQILLHDRKMNPLVSVYYYAPLCLILISVALPFMEGLAPFRAIPQLGAPILLLSGALAFSLNIAGVFLIDSAGSLVLTLSGVLKDIILIVLSVALLGSVIMPTQIGGYGLALAGLVWFKMAGAPPRSDTRGAASEDLWTSISNGYNNGYKRIRPAIPRAGPLIDSPHISR